MRLALGRVPGLVLWRNSVGFDAARKVHYGLCRGSADLIGIYNGKFVALEVKTKNGILSPEQELFLSLVRRLGGIAAVVKSPQQALELFK